MMTDPSTEALADLYLDVGEFGYSLGYFVIPYTARATIVTHVEEARERALTDVARRQGEGTRPPQVNIDYYTMAGRCDLLVAVEQDNLLFINELQNQLSLFPATKTTWIHVVRYDHPFVGREPLYESGMLFQMFLTAKRAAYRQHETTAITVATDIAAKLEEILNLEPFRDIFNLRLYSTLGWADCLLWGSFHGTPQEYNHLLGYLEKFFLLETEEGQEPLFRKRLTMAGFKLDKERNSEGDWTVSPSVSTSAEHQPKFRPFILARTEAGKLEEGSQSVKQYADALADGADYSLRTTDGKWDLLLGFSTAAEPCTLGRVAATINQFTQAWGKGSTQKLKHIDKVETHFLVDSKPVVDPKDLKTRKLRFTAAAFDGGLRYLERRIKRTWEMLLGINRGKHKQQELDRRVRITTPLRNEIASILSLFRLIAKDDDNRQVVDYVIHGALDALQEMIRRLETTQEWVATHKNNKELLGLYSTLQDDLRVWCEVAGRTVRQRASGSFANLFNQPLSVPAMRGSLQKMLLTADGLMREFWGYLPAKLTVNPGEDISAGGQRPPRLASAYVPTVGITSLRYLDLVEIPSRHTFSLQQVLPQLWHEVAERIFFRLFNPFVSTFQHEFNQELRNLRTKGAFPAHLALRHISDHFCDALVFCFGFATDLTSFARYLSSTLSEAAEEGAPGSAQERNSFLQLLDRLLVVQAVKQCVKEKTLTEADILDEIRALRDNIEQLSDLVTIAQREFRPNAASRTKSIEFSGSMKRTLSSSGNMLFDLFASRSLRLLLENYHYDLNFKDCTKIREAIAQGRVVDLDQPENEGSENGTCLANEIYLTYYMKTFDSESRPSFRELAALGFTALQSFKNRDAYEKGISVRTSRLDQ